MILHNDDVNAVVQWRSNAKLSDLARQPVRVRFILQNSKLYAMQFSAQTTDVFKVMDLVTKDYTSAPPSTATTPGRGVSACKYRYRAEFCDIDT